MVNDEKENTLDFVIPSAPSTKISIGGKEIYAHLTMGNLDFLEKALEEKRTDYYSILVDMFSRCENLPSKSIKRSEVNLFIAEAVATDKTLREKYYEHSNGSCYKRFVVASHAVREEIGAKFYNSLSTIPMLKIDWLPIAKSFNANLDFPVINTLANSVQSLIVENQTITSQLAETISSIVQPSLGILNLNPFKDLQSSLLKTLKRIKLPKISEQEKKYSIKAYTYWGELGWTPAPFINKSTFLKIPDSSKEANNQMDMLFRKHSLESVFSNLRQTNIKKKDLDEAISNYNDRRYKSCAMILFALIDAKLIRKQRKGYRPTGKKAVIKLKERTEKYIANATMADALIWTNILAALSSVFENGNNFRGDPLVVNRNFISHGMLNGEVRKRDCIQLFLLLYNMVNHLNLPR